MTLVNSRPDLMNLSFSGCGFLCIYHAGAAAAIKEFAPQLIQNKVLGASAGSLIGCVLLTDVCISHATSAFLKVVSQARSRTFGPLHPEFDLMGIVRQELRKVLPANAYEMCTGRLIISLTRWIDHKNVTIDEYNSNEDLIDAIVCSCFIPMYCGMTPPKFRGVQYIDGGVSDNQPIYDKHTVTVSPFAGESDICPPDWDSGSLLGLDFNGTSIRFTARNMFRLMACLWPISTDDLSKMCLQGFEDAFRFLAKSGLAPCIRCLTIQTIDGEYTNYATTTENVSEDEAPSLRRSVTSPTLSGSKMIKRRSSAALVNGRFRFDSECETCGDSVIDDLSVHQFFPSKMKKPFENAIAAENSLFQYFMSFRILRFARTALGITKFPLDIWLAIAKKMFDYVEFVSPPQWIHQRLKNLVDFIYSEVERQKSRYTDFSCFIAVTDIDRYGSKLAQSTMENDEEREIELSEEAKQELRMLRERDRRKKAKKAAEEKAMAPIAKASCDDIDSFEHVVQFTKNHEALYEFHFMDENNKMHTFGMFVDPTKHRHGNHGASQNTSIGSLKTNRLSHVLEEDEKREVVFSGGYVEEDENSEDEKVSGLETNMSPAKIGAEKHQSTTSKKDACCSPVRDFSPEPSDPQQPGIENSPKSVGRSRGRRDPPSARKTPQPGSLKMSSVFSSDSEEVDGSEKLFVPSRKAYRAIGKDQLSADNLIQYAMSSRNENTTPPHSNVYYDEMISRKDQEEVDNLKKKFHDFRICKLKQTLEEEKKKGWIYIGNAFRPPPDF
ncbi:unnamed protein product [Caenorhabditis bovis]|uniref:triacylglycerol lipase n=1 Tax=Caenorhabditis bovis TaxID=2654633 RepID=A0A8S1EN14_9PELO|nr:unnamed protein product [Caenorhabditis bovis]